MHHSNLLAGISPLASILRLAAASQAGVALRRVCEPVFQGRALEQVDSDEYNKKKVYRKGRPSFYGTRNRNRTCNYPLGGGYYIHLTMQACYLIVIFAWVYKGFRKLCLTGLRHKMLVVFESIPRVFRSILLDILTP